jgi:hypothetical protein
MTSNQAVSFIEGIANPVVVATFTDSTPSPTSDYSAAVDWGDGSPVTTGIGSVLNGTYFATASHAYTEESTLAIPITVAVLTVAIVETNGLAMDAGAVSRTRRVADPQLRPILQTITANKKQAFSMPGPLTDDDPAGSVGDYSASIDWGDGTTAVGTVATNGNGGFDVSGSQTCTEDGSYAVNVSLTDSDTAALTINRASNVVETDLIAAGVGPVPAAEGQSLNSLVAVFSDPGSSDSATAYTALIDLGAGSTTFGSASFDASTSLFLVAGDHTYTDEGTYTTSVAIGETGANPSPAVTVTDTVNVAENGSLSGTDAIVTAIEGLSSQNQVATFTDSYSANPPGDFSATIDWGDGNTTSGTVSGGSGSFTIVGTHTYAEEVLHHEGAPDATVLSAASVSDPSVNLLDSFSLAATEGIDSASQVLAVFADPAGREALGDDAADINWRDGSTTAGCVSFEPSSGLFLVNDSHTYAEEGLYDISITVHHDSAPDGGLNAFEGIDSGSLPVAAFVDPDGAEVVGDYSADIDWGDSPSSMGSILFDSSAGVFLVVDNHLYGEEGTYDITATIHHDSDPDATAVSTAIASDQAVVPFGGFTLIATEGSDSPSQPVAVFLDPAGAEAQGDYSADINWGAGSNSAGSVSFDASSGLFLVQGSHNYADEGTFGITVTIHHDAPPDATALSTAVVTEADVLVPTQSRPGIIASKGQPFNGAVAIFSDIYLGNTADDFTATIAWGDGTTTSGTVTGGDGGFTISGSHVYADEGLYLILATLTDTNDGSGQATATNTAANFALVAEGDILIPTATQPIVAPTEGVAFSGPVATFADVDTTTAAGDFAALIDWGDGTTTVGTVTGGNGSFAISGGHSYADEGFYAINATLIDIDDQLAGLATARATATNVIFASEGDVLTANATPITTTEGIGFKNAQVAPFTSTFTVNVANDFTADILWSDGTSSDGTASGSNGNFTVTGNHFYADEGLLTTTLIIHDDSLGTATATAVGTATVADSDTFLAVGTPVRATEGEAFNSQVAAFTDAYNNTAGDFSAPIDWGDGTATSSTVSGSGGSIATAQITADVSEPPVTPTGSPISGFEQTALNNVVVTTFSHSNNSEPMGNFSAAVDWGDGTTSRGIVLVTSKGCAVLGSHTYTDEGAFKIVVTVTNDGVSTKLNTAATMLEELLLGGARGTANQRFISEVYRDLFHRQVDVTGLMNCTSLLERGVRRFLVVQQIENLNAVYLDTLNRAVDSTGQTNAQIAAANGMTNAQIAAGIFASTEHDMVFAQNLYVQFLHHAMGPLGLNDIVNGLQRGARDEVIIAGVIKSDEFFNKTVF